MYIIPKPKFMEQNQEVFLLKEGFTIAICAECPEQAFDAAKLLKEEVNQQTGLVLRITKTFEPEKYEIMIQRDEACEQEEYKLKITTTGIVLQANSSSGLLYGVQTLRQMLIQCQACLPCLTIQDKPDIPNRGYFFDATRGRILKLDGYKKLADKAAFYKLNQLQLYIEHTFLFQDYSEVCRDDTPLTGEDILELDAYCEKLGIDLVPCLSSFGHLYKVLKTRTYAHLCELEHAEAAPHMFTKRMEHHTIDVSNEESLVFVENKIKEFIPLFRSEYFNICSDETFDLGKGRSKKLAEQMGVHELYIMVVKRLCGVVKLCGKRPMFWGDIVLGKPELMKELPENIICLNWGYAENEAEENTRKMYQTGAVQYLCPGVHGWRHLINRLDAAYKNISLMCRYAGKYKASGVLTTDWGDYGHANHQMFSIPGMIYGAALSWNLEQDTAEELNRQISAVEYMDSSEQFVSRITALAMQEAWHWDHVVQYKEIEQEGASLDKMKEIFHKIGVFDADEINQRLCKEVDALYNGMGTLDSKTRGFIRIYALHARGQQLLNYLGATIGQYRHGIDCKGSKTPRELAVDLETWFSDYKEVWRESCRESELYRVQEVIFYYADMLRTLK